MSIPPFRLRRPFAFALLALPLAACGGGGDDPPTGPDQTPTEIVAASPTTQTATVGTAVAQAPAVTVRNAGGQGVAGVTVTFTVTAGGGSIGSATAQTNASGTASAGSWTLGATAGANSVTATAGTLQPVVFNATGQAVTTNPPPSFLASQIEVANLASCALRQGAGLVCWGTNPQGQLGDGTTTNRPDPAAVSAPGVTFTRVAMGTAHTCALASTGVVHCWGSNNGGRIGDGTTTDRLAPTTVAGGLTFKALAAGRDHSCAIAADDKVYCWGINGAGQLGSGAGANLFASSPTLVDASLTVRSVAAGGTHSCAANLAGIVAYCWGANGQGQLGDGTTTSRSAPSPVNLAGSSFTTVTAGAEFSCALNTGGSAYCWGDNQYGQLGDGSTTDRLSPVAVAGGHVFQQIDAGDSYACGVTTAGALYCWGQNDVGQLGIGSTTSASSPQLVAPPAGQTWKSVSAAIGGKRVCATTSTDAAYCWGTNSGGLTSGDATVNTPSAVRGS